MSSGPPPIPKKKIPRWVWFLTAGGLLLMLALYGAVFGGYFWIMDRAKDEIASANPDFEMLYISNAGKIKVRHKPTGKEFLVDGTAMKKHIPLHTLAIKPVDKLPDWLRLPDTQPGVRGRWESELDRDALRSSLDELLLDRKFILEEMRAGTMTACEPHALQCVTITLGENPAIGGSWYSAELKEAP